MPLVPEIGLLAMVAMLPMLWRGAHRSVHRHHQLALRLAASENIGHIIEPIERLAQGEGESWAKLQDREPAAHKGGKSGTGLIVGRMCLENQTGHVAKAG